MCNPYATAVCFGLIGYVSWANNCAANNQTNGVDLKIVLGVSNQQPKLSRGIIMDKSRNAPVLTPNLAPTLPTVGESSGVVKSYMLDNNTAVVSSYRLSCITRFVD